MWKFSVRQGSLRSDDGVYVTQAYSGHNEGELYGVNNPDLQAMPGIGPIPVGLYQISAPVTSQQTGPYAMSLTPLNGTDTHGRSAFEIHGDLVGQEGKQLASHGCVIVDRPFRERIWQSGDHLLSVVAEEEDTPNVC